MKTFTKISAICSVLSVAFAPSSFAQLNIPSDGSDGALNITADTVIDLSQAPTATWSAPGAGNGVYDPTQWAVVFKYSCVNIANGATVTFNNHYANPPVVWLVQSNVTIGGTVNMDGDNGSLSAPAEYLPTAPGPGGFRGGALDASFGIGDGLGPGGGVSANGYNGTYQSSYGNAQILPLIGGSGGGAGNGTVGSGGAGGGAILIAAGGTVSVNGAINATAGLADGVYYAGAGGGIRVVANQITGNGSIDAGFEGRTRMEANSMSQDLIIVPNAAVVSPGSAPVIWRASNAPTVNIISVGGFTAPSDPMANVSSSPDIGISTNSPVTVVLQTANFPTNGIVTVRVVPIYGASSALTATFASGNATSATWQLTAQIPLGYCVLQAHATAQ